MKKEFTIGNVIFALSITKKPKPKGCVGLTWSTRVKKIIQLAWDNGWRLISYDEASHILTFSSDKIPDGKFLEINDRQMSISTFVEYGTGSAPLYRKGASMELIENVFKNPKNYDRLKFKG